jgi:hypothetical protein
VNSQVAVFGVLAISVIAYLLGRVTASRTERQRRGDMCTQSYNIALAHRRASQHIEGALAAAEAAGHVRRHECYDLVAQSLDEIALAAASDYWARARAAARQQAAHQQGYYYYREAKSYLRAKNPEFAHLRSKAAIELIELGHIPSVVDGRDYLQHLRAVRMISALQHFKGSEAWKAALTDAVWLQRNADDSTLQGLGASMSAAHLAGEITAEMIEAV